VLALHKKLHFLGEIIMKDFPVFVKYKKIIQRKDAKTQSWQKPVPNFASLRLCVKNS
jgi:hypothetical protein